MDPTFPEDGIPGGWKKVGTGRFSKSDLPMTDVAARLSRGEERFLLYGEYDTNHEKDVWGQFVYDPLKVLKAEGVPLPKQVHIVIVKLPDDGMGDSAEYLSEVEARRAATEDALKRAEEPDRSQTVTTTIINHELGLNPRVAQVSVY